MTDGTSVININAGVLEDVEDEDNREGWSDGPDAVVSLSSVERAVFDALVWAQQMPDDEDDACPLCTHWTCTCP